jgi:MoaA/NifB/PqqE/SkfB family radical SAM enzyme
MPENKTFCLFPFFNLNNNSDGHIKLCCNISENIHVKDKDGRDFNLGTDDIDVIWNSDYMNTVRDKMLSGEKVKECYRCYEHELRSGHSSRTAVNIKWQNSEEVKCRLSQYKNDKTIDPLVSLELRLGNTCNLSCNTCWGYSSSKSHDERVHMLKSPISDNAIKISLQAELNVPKDMNKWFKSDTYSNNMMKSAKNLKRLYMTGGEPTLIKENVTFLRYLIECGNTQCHISFTTNGMTSDSYLLSLLSNFPNCEIQISCDAVGDQAQYVRYPTIWTEFANNVDSMLALANARIVFFTVISAYNLHSLPNVLTYLNELNNKREVFWSPILLDYAQYLHTHIWPRSERLVAAEELQKRVDELLNIKWIQPHIDRVLHFYRMDAEYTDRISTFLEYNSMLDANRGTSLAETFPEMSDFITYRKK